MDPIILHQDDEVLVVREGDFAVKKVIKGRRQLSGYFTSEEMVSREKQALQILAGIPGIQTLAEKQSNDPNTIITHYIEGTPLKNISARMIYKKQAIHLLGEMNKKGIKKILGTSNDIIIDTQGQLHLIDFGHVVFDTEAISCQKVGQVYQEIKTLLLFR